MVIKLKNVYFILLLTLLSALFLGSFSTSYAILNYTEINEAVDKLCNGEIFNVGVASAVKSKIYDETNGKNLNYWCIALCNSASPTDYAGKILFYANRDKNPSEISLNQWSLWFYKNGNRFSSGNSAFYMRSYTYCYSTLNVRYQNYFTINEGEVGGNYVSEPDIYFIPNKDYIVTYKGQSDVNALLRNYSINQWKIGETYDFSTLDAFHMYFYDLTNNVELGRIFAYKETDSISGTNALYFSQGNLYVNSRYINYQTLYRLDISKFLENNEYNETHYFVFAPRNATVQSGVIINFGSGDYTIQDSTNAIINNQESGDNKIIGTLTDDSEIDTILDSEFTSNSGDIEIYAEKFGFTPLDNPFTTFLLHILDGTFDALTEPNNTTLSADYKTLHFELNSDDFTTPDSPTKDFIRNLLIFLYLYGNYRFFNHLIILIQTAKIDKAIAVLGTDEFYDSDIM